MKFTIGYQLPDEYDSTLEICRDYRDSISGVYFSYGSEPSGRLPLYAEEDEDAVIPGLLPEHIRMLADRLRLK